MEYIETTDYAYVYMTSDGNRMEFVSDSDADDYDDISDLV